MKRLLDETENETERALLQAGRSYRGSRETMAKTLAALGLAGATATAATTTASAASAATLAPVAKAWGVKLLLAVSVVSAVAAVPIGYQIFARKQPAAASVMPSRSVPSAAGQPAALGATLSADPLPTPDAAKLPRTGPRTPDSAAGGPVPLGRELAALDAARSTLVQGNPQAAILLLDGYAQTCPHGRLELEAELLRMEALFKGGQVDAARRRASTFLKRHPTSVLAARARSYLGE
jgi:hypothetical protein